MPYSEEKRISLASIEAKLILFLDLFNKFGL